MPAPQAPGDDQQRASNGVLFHADRLPQGRAAGARQGRCRHHRAQGVPREAQKARDIIEAWVRDEWPGLWGRRPRVLLKTQLEEVYFALYVEGAPPGTEPRDMEALFEKYGRLHANKICSIKNSDNAYFVNFAHYDGALAALEAVRGETLRFKAATLYANAARNTTFLTQLTTQMRDSGRNSFSLDDAKRVGKQMTSWPPKEDSIENLLKVALNPKP